MFVTDVEKPKERLYLLRWRYDFHNGVVKYGQWSAPDNNPQYMAAMQMREGLSRASVEAKNIRTRETKILAECDGWDYVVFKWMACGFVRGMVRGSHTPYTRMVGLKIVTREREIEVYDTGDILITQRPEADKTIQYAIYGA